MVREIELFESINEELGTNFKSNKTIDWDYILITQTLSESFIEKYKGYLSWTLISIHQKLSEEFIEKHQDKVYWHFISSHQVLSEKFIKKYSDKIEWDQISQHQKLSKEFVDRYKDKINFTFLKNNFLYNTDIGKDWFIAYIVVKTAKNLNNRIKFYSFKSIKLNKIRNFIKVRIYYKDLLSNHMTRKVTYLRVINNFKIM